MSVASPASELNFLEFPSDDVVFMRIQASPVRLTDSAELLRARAEKGPFYLAVDFTSMTGNLDAESREQGPKLIKPEWILGAVYINASLPLRMAIKVFNLAMFLTGRGDFPTEFVASEQELSPALERLRRENRPR